MRIYLDVSCLNRPFDDQKQERVRLEGIAVTTILEDCLKGRWTHVSSAMAVREIAANPNPDRQRQARELLPGETAIIDLDEKIVQRADMLVALGFKPADATHLAAAEQQAADVFLTCDDRLLRLARRSRGLKLRIENPLAWLREQKNE